MDSEMLQNNVACENEQHSYMWACLTKPVLKIVGKSQREKQSVHTDYQPLEESRESRIASQTTEPLYEFYECFFVVDEERYIILSFFCY